MNAIPPFSDTRLRNRAAGGDNPITERWLALEEAGALIAALTEVRAASRDIDECDFSAMIRDAENWRRERAGLALDDLVAIMEPGIAALLAIKTRGADPRSAAQALWREFAAARSALLGLLSPRA